MCEKVRLDFYETSFKLSSVLAVDGSAEANKPATDFQTLETRYNDLLEFSRLLAVSVAQQASDFNDIVIPVVGDENISIDRRKGEIVQFITRAKQLDAEAADLQKTFEDFVSDVTNYIARFGTWATKEEGEMNVEIAQLWKEFTSMNQEISHLKALMERYGASGGILTRILGVVGICAGPFAPFLYIFAGFAAIGTVSYVVTLALRVSVTKDQIQFVKTRIAEDNKQVSQIRQTRSNLEKVGEVLAHDVHTTIGIINQAWAYCQNDAILIEAWLKDGKENADIPFVVASALGHADGICKSLIF